MFHEVTDQAEQTANVQADKRAKREQKIQCTNRTMKAFQQRILHYGANITVLGVGGAGRNAIRNMQASGLGRFVRLIAMDTDTGCDITRYSRAKRGQY